MTRAKDVPDATRPRRYAFCGGRSPDGVWIGARKIGVCLQCAESVLPRLMADAIAKRINPQRDDVQETTDRHWQTARANFYDAAHRNACKTLDGRPQAHSGGLS